ncbi:MAG TPA: hypothetical protein VKB93_12405 [Thermoanaerobaculia bacterium]|nr:hypothetical protein [Thermoanaerobaculia bacterium]
MRLLERVDDWMNPIAVKELRQAVRGKFVAVAVVLSLFGQLLAVGFMALTTSFMSRSPAGEVQPGGPMTFMALYVVLFTICIFLVPAYSGFRMAAERADANIDLLFITTIQPRTIVTGKLICIVALVVLLFSASLPFLVFSYVLRGIDLVSILVLLFIAFTVVISHSVLALFIGCLPASKSFKILLAAIFLFLTFATYPPVMAFAGQALRIGFGASALTSRFWTGVMAFTATIIAVDAILLIVTTAMLMPPVANRALPIRATFAVMWAVTYGGAALVTLVDGTDRMLGTWAVCATLLISLVLLSAIGEREWWAPRVARAIPASPPRRVLAFLFFSGAGGGILWSVLFFAATILLYAVTRVGEGGVRELADAAMCMVAYALTAALIRRKWLTRIAPRFTWTIGLVLFLLLAIIPALVAFLVDADAGFSGYLSVATIANPFPNRMRSDGAKDVRTVTLLFWCFVELALNGPWIAQQFARFRRFRAPDEPEVDWGSPLGLHGARSE